MVAMKYPFKYPMLYGELAMQAKTKKELADYLQISMESLREKQRIDSNTDFDGKEMCAASKFLEKSVEYLFNNKKTDTQR